MQGSMQQNGEQSPILLPQSNEHGTNGQTGHTGHVNVASVITQVSAKRFLVYYFRMWVVNFN